MSPPSPPPYTLFAGLQRIASGALAEVAQAAASQPAAGPALQVFSDTDGHPVELDLRGGVEAVRERYGEARVAAPEPAPPRGRGRPRLGVVAREVTLLPEHWDWLASQPGGPSVTLRKLVQQARREGSARDRLRRAQERSYRVMVALAGDLPGFEEAARALFAGDAAAFRSRIGHWPGDVAAHLARLAEPEDIPTPGEPHA